MNVYLVKYAGDLIGIASSRSVAERLVSEYWGEPYSKQMMGDNETTIERFVK